MLVQKYKISSDFNKPSHRKSYLSKIISYFTVVSYDH